MLPRRNRLCRAALVLPLLVLAAIVTGVAPSATTPVLPKRLTGTWTKQTGFPLTMVVSPRGKVEIPGFQVEHAKFSHVTAHRLTISGLPSCSGTGTYRWTRSRTPWLPQDGPPDQLKFKKIHDACKLRVNLFTDDTWAR
jgi:hypothetical protein